MRGPGLGPPAPRTARPGPRSLPLPAGRGGHSPVALALCLISGTPPGGFCPTGALPAPSSLVGPLGAQPRPWDVHRLARGFTQGQPVTSQHATPGMRAAGPSGSGSPTVSFNRAHQAGAWGPWQGPHSCKQGPLPGVGRRENGAPWGRGRSSVWHGPQQRPALPPRGEGLRGPARCPACC